MYPHERSLVKKLAGQPFALIGVNSDRDREDLKNTLKEKDLTWRSFFDGGGTGGPIATRWRVSGWPTIYVIDAKGIIRAKDVRGKDLDRWINELVAEAGGDPNAEPTDTPKEKKPTGVDL